MTTNRRRSRLQGKAVTTLLLVLSGCAGSTGAATREASVDTAELRSGLAVLAADSMAGRRTGTAGAARSAAFIARELQRYGVPPAYSGSADGDSAYFQKVPLVRRVGGAGIELVASWDEFAAAPTSRQLEEVNVVGVIEGSDPALRNEAIIVGAHYDHVGIGAPVGGDSIYNGADDDASGVVTVLQIGRALVAGPPPGRTVILLFTTGEEQGLLGTRWYIREPVVPLERTVADLQIEMVGRPDEAVGGAGQAWLTGYARSTLGRELASAGVPIVDDPRPAQRFFERSDNIAFACQGIPAHTLSSFGLHGDYHGPDDEVDRIDFDHLAVVAGAATRAVRLLAQGDRPEWLPGGDPSQDSAICG